MQRLKFHDGRINLGVGGPKQESDILQKVADTDGGNQNCQRCGGTQRTVSQPFNYDTEDGTNTHCNQQCEKRRCSERINTYKGNVSTDHDNIAMSKVQHLCNAVDHGIAEGDNCIDAAKAQAVD